MIHTRPPIFFNITPLNPTGVTVVDLGEMDGSFEGARYSSLPPVTTPVTETHWQTNNARGGRHQSLPPTMMAIKPAHPVSAVENSETSRETDDSADSVLSEEIGPSPRKRDNRRKVSHRWWIRVPPIMLNHLYQDRAPAEMPSTNASASQRERDFEAPLRAPSVSQASDSPIRQYHGPLRFPRAEGSHVHRQA